LRESGIENVERILELGEDKLKEIPGVGDKTAAKIMEAAKDLFEEVEIEVPEGMDLPTAIQSATEEETAEAEPKSSPESASESSSASGATVAEKKDETQEASGQAEKADESPNTGNIE
jgi:Holliday junction resolvasome RuvABC DNA-binding subunit